MAAAPFGVMSLMSLIIMAAGFGGLPLGMPPLPEDPLISRVAPEECLYYLSSSGADVPKGNSSNATERMLAESEIAGLYDKLEKEILAVVRREEEGNEEAIKVVNDAAQLIRTMATRPFALYISEVQIAGEKGPSGKGGMIVNLGDDAAEIEKTLLGLEASAKEEFKGGDEHGFNFEIIDEAGVSWHQFSFPAPAVPIAWGVRGRYLLIGIGENAGPEMVARASSEPPKWLTEAKSRLPVERISMLTYLNLAGARELAGPLMMAPQVSSLVQSFSADKVDAVISISGLDAEAAISRTLIKTASGSSEAGGLLSLADGAPITAADLEHIPADATIAAAMRLDATKVLSWAFGTIQQVEPRVVQDFNEVEQIISQVTGADFREQIIPALGDVWSLYASPADGGFPWTGTVLSVSVKDHETLSNVQDKLVEFMRQNLPDPPENPRRSHASLRSVKVGSDTIYFMNIVERENPVAPAWCLTQDRLNVAFYPQSIKGMLSIDSAEKRLPELPEVAEQLNSSAPLMGISYLDTKALFRTVYPAIQIGLQMAAAEWQREGFRLDISVLPPARTIERHLKPSTMAFTRASDGLEFTSHQSIPGGSIAGTLPVFLGVSLPAVGSARQAARATQDMNTMKQILLAMHMYQAEHDSFPATQRAVEKGKGLSWRVQLLPYLDQKALYDKFRHDEPWDSEHNLSLIKEMPDLFRSTSHVGHAVAMEVPAKKIPAGEVDESEYAAYRTPFVTLQHEDSVFPPGATKGTKFRDITGGISNTIAFVMADPSASVIWTKPDDIQFDPAKPFDGLRGVGGNLLVGFCDGHISRMRLPFDGTLFKVMVTKGQDEEEMRDD